ncbi:MAG: hypothetical protein EOM91_21395 [Sphingobacteriia bacterium]|nr:hypothetical protein [Sphingobacteriia bacterium]
MTEEQRTLFKQRFAGMSREDREALFNEWQSECGCEAACPDECWVEPDGECDHGHPSWFLVFNWI